MARKHKFTFSNGETLSLSYREASAYILKNRVTVEKAPLDMDLMKPGKIKDNFEPGFNPALGRYVGSKDEHKRILKDRGLVEMGNEDPNKFFSKKKDDGLIDHETIKELNEKGVDLSDSDAKALLEK